MLLLVLVRVAESRFDAGGIELRRAGSGLLRLRLAEGSSHHPCGLRPPLRILPVEFQSIPVGIEEIDALVPAVRVLFQTFDLRTLVDEACVQLLERLQAAIGLDRNMVE